MSAPDVEALLREHGLALSDDAGRWMCRCGWTTQTVPVATDHRAHQAAIITAAYAEALARVRAEVLREAAAEVDHIERIAKTPWCESSREDAEVWRESHLGSEFCVVEDEDRLPLVSRWLRDRADRIEGA